MGCCCINIGSMFGRLLVPRWVLELEVFDSALGFPDLLAQIKGALRNPDHLLWILVGCFHSKATFFDLSPHDCDTVLQPADPVRHAVPAEYLPVLAGASVVRFHWQIAKLIYAW